MTDKDSSCAERVQGRAGPKPQSPLLATRRAQEFDGPVSMAVVEAVAEARGMSPMEMEAPLYECVDPDALDQLFDPDSGASVDGKAVFSVAGCRVTVTAGRDVLVHPAE